MKDKWDTKIDNLINELMNSGGSIVVNQQELIYVINLSPAVNFQVVYIAYNKFEISLNKG